MVFEIIEKRFNIVVTLLSWRFHLEGGNGKRLSDPVLCSGGAQANEMVNNFVDGRTGAKGFFDKKADNVVIQGNTSSHTTMLRQTALGTPMTACLFSGISL